MLQRLADHGENGTGLQSPPRTAIAARQRRSRDRGIPAAGNRSVIAPVCRFLCDDAGPTSVEYAVILMAIIAVCVGAITVIGNVTNTHFENAGDAFPKGQQ